MNPEESELAAAISLECAECGQSFSVCRACWRGQRYCGDACRLTAKLKCSRERQKKYAKTEKGLEFGRIRQQRRYEKIKLLKSSH